MGHRHSAPQWADRSCVAIKLGHECDIFSIDRIYGDVKHPTCRLYNGVVIRWRCEPTVDFYGKPVDAGWYVVSRHTSLHKQLKQLQILALPADNMFATRVERDGALERLLKQAARS